MDEYAKLPYTVTMTSPADDQFSLSLHLQPPGNKYNEAYIIGPFKLDEETRSRNCKNSLFDDVFAQLQDDKLQLRLRNKKGPKIIEWFLILDAKDGVMSLTMDTRGGKIIRKLEKK